MRSSHGTGNLPAPGMKPRSYHKHECGHWDICYLNDVDASASDCRNCRNRKFNQAARPTEGRISIPEAGIGSSDQALKDFPTLRKEGSS